MMARETLLQFGHINYRTSYEGPILANQKSRKLGVFCRKLEGSHSQCYHYFDTY